MEFIEMELFGQGKAEANDIGKVRWMQLWKGGPKFAVYNVGATSATEYGGYYCWGNSNDESSKRTQIYNDGSEPLAGDTDTATTLGADQYALSLGQHGVGFYLWDGKTIGANKAYLTIDEALGVKALKFRFDDEPAPTGIKAPSSSPKGESPATYDLKGMRVNDSYKGIVIKNGKKVIR